MGKETSEERRGIEGETAQRFYYFQREEFHHEGHKEHAEEESVGFRVLSFE
jgi:hypothetical protein